MQTVPAEPLSTPAPASPVPRPAPTPPLPDVVVLPPPSTQTRYTLPPPPLPPPPLKPPPFHVPVERSNTTPLGTLNNIRLLAKLPPVGRNKTWDAECFAHARYLLSTDTGSHSEDPQNPHYSKAGAACAPGHYFVTMRPDATVTRALRYWMNGPFHLPQMLDPHLRQVGFAVVHDLAGEVRTAAVLDLKRGRSGVGHYPVKFPAPGVKVAADALSEYEYPDALPGCPGYAHPAGAPIVLLLGQGKSVRSAKLTVNGTQAESCLLTAETFTGSSENDTRVGRSVLGAQGVAALIPRQPLPERAVIAVSFQTGTGKVAWNFQTR